MPAPQTVSVEKARQQQNELDASTQAPGVAAIEVPKNAAPGGHPLRCIEDDAEALAAYRGDDRAPGTPEDGLWHRNAWNQPVFVRGDSMPAAAGGR
ncbi:MAG TPA: hypothetical protein VIM84_15455 [Gemmatimonadales bacterium]